MKFGMLPIDELIEFLCEKNMKYADTIIIGDNSSGKSMLLKAIVERMGKTDSVYFIDAVNRTFDAKKASTEKNKPEYKRTIIETRMKPDFFNLKDSFDCFGTSVEQIERIYFLFERKVQRLFKKLTGESFKIVEADPLGEVQFGKKTGLLSSGYQAMIRVLLELLYYQEMCISEKKLKKAMVIIDELDEFLSPGYSFSIMPFLKAQFPKMEFIVTTHSCDLVAGAQNANLIALRDGTYEVMDVNDFQTVSEVQIVFERVFGEHLVQKDDIEDELRRLFNNKMNHVWGEKEKHQLEQIQKERLTASQQLIYKQIVEW